MDCSKYNINVEELFLTFVPYFWLVTPETGADKTTWLEYLKSIASSYENARDEAFNTCLELKSFLTPTGQHLSLEKLLNDTYDPTLRRLFITENDIPASANVWFLEGENDIVDRVWYLEGEADPIIKTWFLEPEMSARTNFTINIPTAVSYTEEILRGLIDPYIVNGYKYDIITF